MKGKTAFFLSICFSTTTILAQQIVVEIPMQYNDPKFGKKESSAWLSYCSNSKQFILSVIEKDEVNHVLLNESMNIADSFSEIREKMGDYAEPYYYSKYLPRKNTLYGKQFKRIGSYLWEGHTYISVFEGEKNHGIYFHLLDFSKKISTYISSWLPEDDEEIIGYYQIAGKPCWATLWGKKKKEFRFYELKKDFSAGHMNIGLQFKDVDLSNFTADKLMKDIALIDPVEYPDYYEASRKIKIYPAREGIYISLNGNSPVTTLIFADAVAGLVTENTFNHRTGNIAAEKIISSCSIKYGNYLFLLSTSADQVFTTIYNLKTGDIEKESVVTEDHIILQKEQPEHKKKYEKGVRTFFELLNKGDLFIKSVTINEDMEMTIGSCAQVKIMNRFYDASIARTPNTAGIEGYWVSSAGAVNLFKNVERSLTYVTATSRINRQNFQTTEMEDVPDETDKQTGIWYLIAGIRDPKAVAICKTGNTFYTGYYTEASGKYTIHKF